MVHKCNGFVGRQGDLEKVQDPLVLPMESETEVEAALWLVDYRQGTLVEIDDML